MAKALACVESPEYQVAAFCRDGGGTVEIVIVEGVDATTA